MHEKRYDPRYQVSGECDLRVLYSRSDPKAVSTRRVKALVRDMSQGGVCVQTPEPFQEGDLADCAISLQAGKTASSLGLVKWNVPGKGVGIEFFYGSEEEREAIRREVRQAINPH